MVLKRFAILANSRKYHEHCIAGIDLEEGKLIRIIDDQNIENHYAIRDDDLICKCGTSAEVLDIIELNCTECGKEHPTSYFQPENYAMVPGTRWKKIDKFPTSDLNKYLSKEPYLWYGDYDRVYPGQIAKKPISYSLILIKPENVKFSLENGKKLKTTFDYKGYTYKLSVTDPDYEFNSEKYPENGNYNYLISLGVLWGEPAAHYKLVSQIFKL